jgi:hypothetical protein
MANPIAGSIAGLPCAPHDRPVVHHSGMTLRAVRETQFDFTSLADDPMHERVYSLPRQRRSGGAIQLRSSHLWQEEACVETDRRFEYEFTGLNPVRFRLQCGPMSGVIPKSHWLAVLKPSPISLWFMTRFVNWVALVNRTYRNAVVVAGAHMYRRSLRMRQRHFQRLDCGIIPGPRNRRSEGSARLLGRQTGAQSGPPERDNRPSASHTAYLFISHLHSSCCQTGRRKQTGSDNGRRSGSPSASVIRCFTSPEWLCP